MKSRRVSKHEDQDLLKGNWGTAIKLNIVPVVGQVLTGLAFAGIFAGLVYFFTRYTSFADHYFSFGDNDSGSTGQSFVGELITTYLLVSVDYTGYGPRRRLRTRLSMPFKHLRGAILSRPLCSLSCSGH